MRAIILIERLSLWTLLLAYCLPRGWRLFYLYAGIRLPAEGIRGPLARRFVPLTYERFSASACDEERLYAREKRWAVFLREHFAESGNSVFQPLCKAFGLGVVDRARIGLAIEDKLMHYVEGGAHLCNFAEYFKDRIPQRKVFVWLHRTRLVSDCLRRFEGGSIDRPPWHASVIFTIAEALDSLIGGGQRALSLLNSRMKRRAPAKSAIRLQQPLPEPADYRVIYFPHMGIFYGELFPKDQFYSTNRSSPFHRTQVLHLSLGDRLRKPSLDYYHKHSIPYCDLSDLRPAAHAVRLARKPPLSVLLRNLKAILLNEEPASTLLSIWGRLTFYRQQLSSLKNVRIALVGYETLFDQALTVALNKSGIVTVATQERFFAAFHPRYVPAVDYYFVASELVKSQIFRRDLRPAMGAVIPSGIQRVDAIAASASRYPYKKMQGRRKLIVALDYRTELRPDMNRIAVSTNWKIVRDFYHDMVRLAIKRPDLFIVLKGKTRSFLHNRVFRDLLRTMDYIPNIYVERRIEAVSPYEAVSSADLVIGLQTSLLDECLAAGIPALIYQNNGLPEAWYDYNASGVVVRNFEELMASVRLAISGQYLGGKGAFEKLRKDLYGAWTPGTVRKRIRRHIGQIYEQQSRIVSGSGVAG